MLGADRTLREIFKRTRKEKHAAKPKPILRQRRADVPSLYPVVGWNDFKNSTHDQPSNKGNRRQNMKQEHEARRFSGMKVVDVPTKKDELLEFGVSVQPIQPAAVKMAARRAEYLYTMWGDKLDLLEEKGYLSRSVVSSSEFANPVSANRHLQRCCLGWRSCQECHYSTARINELRARGDRLRVANCTTQELYCDHPQSLRRKKTSKRRNMFQKNKKQETTENAVDNNRYAVSIPIYWDRRKRRDKKAIFPEQSGTVPGSGLAMHRNSF
ncbi:hypothetical protein AAG570_011416 [Ranatra chinensis]|uniref:Uncharacterized protein n=1 Tax=Ranatra chinensis TaxID=642074 RepID=A0ABD0Z8V8_9HEMI